MTTTTTCPDTIIIEIMPAYLRETHRAAGNSGSYPHNGSARYIIPADLSGYVEEDEWTRVVRVAVTADFERYEYREEIPEE